MGKRDESRDQDVPRAWRLEAGMMPKSKLGKCAGVLLVVFLISLVAIVLYANLGGRGRGTPLGMVAGTCTMAAGIAAFVTGIVSLTKLRDRSLVVILAVVLGSFAILVSVMEAVEVISARGGAPVDTQKVMPAPWSPSSSAAKPGG
jgi:hypothetical protein